MKKTNETKEMKTYLLRGSDGTKRITIPAEWKITYGKLHGGREENGKWSGGSGQPNVLRIYESKEKQRAIFTNIVEFRDTSIKCEKLVTNKEEKIEILHSRGITDAKEQRKHRQVWIEDAVEEEIEH